jgi:hypothetical protein
LSQRNGQAGAQSIMSTPGGAVPAGSSKANASPCAKRRREETMTRDEIHRALLAALAQAAPNADVLLLDPARPLREQVELDTAQWLGFLAAVQAGLGVELPDAGTGPLCTLEQFGHHCEDKLASRA